MKHLSLLLSVALAAAGLSVMASPAEAVTNVTVTAPSVSVREGDCKTTRIVINGDWNTDPNNSIDLSVTDPNGDYATSDFFYDENSSQVYSDFMMCDGIDASGWYTVTATVEGSDENFENPTTRSATRYFKFSTVHPWRANTSLTRKAKRIHSGKYMWRVVGHLVRSGRSYVGQGVAIQALIGGDWTFIEGSKTRKRGLFGWKFKPNSYVFRYVYYGNSNTKPAVSAAFRTPRRGRATRETPADPRSYVTAG